jgi:electron transfer flavoprotein alpha subunit
MADRILVVAEDQEGRLARAAWEAVAAGQSIARAFGAAVVTAVAGANVASLANELAGAEISESLALTSPLLEDYTAEGFTAALAPVIERQRPRFVVFSHTYQTRDFAPRLAARFSKALIGDCLGYRREGDRAIFVRPVFQGKLLADTEPLGDPPCFVSFQAGTFREDSVRRSAQPAPVTAIAASLSSEAIRTHPGERFREAKQTVDLTQADIIVAVGRGIKSPENLELAKKLAEVLNAELGASRPICDSGWLPMDRQIGSSGQTVAPRLYVALGISGAIQHQVGMKGSRTIVAINKDNEAPIFEIATYGIVGDLFEVVPALIEEIKKAKTR